MRAILLFALTIAAQNDGSEQNQNGRAGTFAIVGARIVTVSGAVIENGTVLIQNGKIAAVGANVSMPAGVEKIDGKGLSVFPGMIDAGTNLGLVEIGQGVNGSVDVSETGSMNANAKAIKGIHPHSAHVEITRVNGITTVLSVPTGGIIAGQAAVINLSGSTQDEMAVVREFAPGDQFSTDLDFWRIWRRRPPDRRIYRSGQTPRYSVGRAEKDFRNAENYVRAQDAYAKDKTLPYPATDIRLEAMEPFIRGEKPVIFTAERESDIRGVAKFVEDMNLKGIIGAVRKHGKQQMF